MFVLRMVFLLNDVFLNDITHRSYSETQRKHNVDSLRQQLCTFFQSNPSRVCQSSPSRGRFKAKSSSSQLWVQSESSSRRVWTEYVEFEKKEKERSRARILCLEVDSGFKSESSPSPAHHPEIPLTVSLLCWVGWFLCEIIKTDKWLEHIFRIRKISRCLLETLRPAANFEPCSYESVVFCIHVFFFSYFCRHRKELLCGGAPCFLFATGAWAAGGQDKRLSWSSSRLWW